MHHSDNGQSPLLGIYRSTEVETQTYKLITVYNTGSPR